MPSNEHCLGCEFSWAEQPNDAKNTGHCYMFREFSSECKLNKALRGRVQLYVYDRKGGLHYNKSWHLAVLKIEPVRNVLWIKCPEDGMLMNKDLCIITSEVWGTRVDYYPHQNLPEKMPLKLSGNMLTIDLEEANENPS
jgi:hypothetical protein